MKPDKPLPTATLESIQNRLILDKTAWELTVAQAPLNGYVLAASKRSPSAKGPDKRALDPPAVVEFVVEDQDQFKSYLWSPYFFCTTALVPDDGEPYKRDMLTGSLTSSLHIVRGDDKKKTYHGYFIFGDLCPQFPGRYKLQFTVFEMSPESMFATKLSSVFSPAFTVETCSKIPPPMPSTHLTKMLSDGGVKLRLRKEPTPKVIPKVNEWNIPAQPQAAMPHQSLPANVLGARYVSHSIAAGNSHYMPNAVDISNRIRVQHREQAWALGSSEATQEQHCIVTPGSNHFWLSQQNSAMFPQYYDLPPAQSFQGHAPMAQFFPHQAATQASQMDSQTAHFFPGTEVTQAPPGGAQFAPYFPRQTLNHGFQEQAQGMRYFQASAAPQAPATTAAVPAFFETPAVMHSSPRHVLPVSSNQSQSGTLSSQESRRQAPYFDGPAMKMSPEMSSQGSTYFERPAVTHDQYFQLPAMTYAAPENVDTTQYLEQPMVTQAPQQNSQGMNFLDLAMGQGTDGGRQAGYLQVTQGFQEDGQDLRCYPAKDPQGPLSHQTDVESYHY